MSSIKTHPLCLKCKMVGCRYNPLPEREAVEKQEATKISPKLTNWIYQHWSRCYCPRNKSFHSCGGIGWTFDVEYLNNDFSPKYINLISDIRSKVPKVSEYEKGHGMEYVLDKDRLAKNRVITPTTLTVCSTWENNQYHAE